MPRRVLYDASAPPVAAAAALLRDDFEVLPLVPGPRPVDASGAVVLVGGDSALRPSSHERIVALVDTRADRDWPAEWYALVPEAPGRAVLRRALDNAFADLDAAAGTERLEREMSELNAIGVRLTSERDPHVLLELILRTAREITRSDAGSLYLVEEDEHSGHRLRFALAQNDSLSVPFETTTMPLSRDSLAGWVALEGHPLNLEDAYVPPADALFRIDRSFDDRTGYRTKSMLVVPMQTPQGETIGVLQLINCKPAFALILDARETIENVVLPFSDRFVALASSLASQAAVALQNSRLHESIRQLFDGFVRASVVAIEARDPTTAGHSFRVADLSVALAEAVHGAARGPYASVTFTPEDLMELRYAGLLHDVGKIGVREHVLVKTNKLSPEGLERIRGRIEAFRRGVEIVHVRRKLDVALNKGLADYEVQAPLLDAELAVHLAELDASLARIVALNQPSVQPRETAQEVARLAARLVDDPHSGRQPLITEDEAAVLGIPRGSLTAKEFDEIRAHVVHSWEFLVQIPWTREFRRVPAIAGAHHEKLDGSGYPHGLGGEQIPVQSRIMTIADIYDALTAFDRPYKPSVRPETALEILGEEQRLGHIDGDLLDLFVDARIWERQKATR